MLTGPSSARSMALHLQRHPDIALLCVNDDIAIDEDQTAALFRQFAQAHWGTPARWERTAN